ncbi:MAG: hypothetical protein PHF12_00300 [Candidatus Omnitrophica bacterium]|nr:hypothetical protein [Candidatus Omnitrophota bacterium]
MKKIITTALLAVTLLALIAGCQARSDTFTDSLKITAQKTTLEEASKTSGFTLPVPGYLPQDYKIQEVYIQDGSVRLLISDKEIEKKLVSRSNTSGSYQEYEFQCPMEINIVWGSQGIPGGLKLPGERPQITPTQGTTIASVIVDRESHNDLWWDWRPNLNEPGMYEIVISATKRISNKELVKVSESISIPSGQASDNVTSVPNASSPGQLPISGRQSNEIPTRVISLTSPISSGLDATLVVETLPGAECSAIVDYGPSGNSVLPSRIADGNGKVSWTWPVGKFSGTWQITIKASYGGKSVNILAPFTIR